MALPRPIKHTFTLLKLLCVLAIAGVVCAGFFVPYVAGIGLGSNKAADKFLDTTCNLKESALDQTTSVYARDGKTLITTLFEDNRKSVPLASIPVTVRQALIDTEDRRFGTHHGVDTRGLVRAALNESGGETQGASTLTQQLVKQIRYYQADTVAAQKAATEQTVDRKIYEAKCALDLEKRYSKNQILEKYLNIAYFGEQSYGIYVAARTYFGKLPAQLTVPEAAVIAGLVKDPTLYDPFRNAKQARQRRDEVIQNMVEAGHITARAAIVYKKSPIRLTTQSSSLGAQGCSYARDTLIKNVGFFCQYTMDWLENTLEDHVGGGLTDRQLKTGGYKIVTSIDPAAQNRAQDALFKYPATAATTVIQPAIDPSNGEILSMATSKHFTYGSVQVGKPGYTSNRIFKGAFSGSGSTYKYFTTIAALEAGLKPEQNLTTSSNYAPVNCPKHAPTIHNAGNYKPTLSLRNALVSSSNTYFVGLEDQVFNCDLTTVVDTAVHLGMHALTLTPAGSKVSYASAFKRDSAYTFTLGQANTSALELTEAYGIAANDGISCAAKPVLSITDAKGTPVKFKQAGCERKMDPWVARTAVDMMKGDTVTGTAANTFRNEFYDDNTPRDDHWVASKTGTNNSSICDKTGTTCTDSASNSSIWFVGMTPKLVATSAIINIDKPTSVLKIPASVDAPAASQTFGAFASKYWIASFKSALTKTPWQWDAASQVPGSGEDVPKVIGMLPDQAEQTLRDAGYKPVRYSIDCGSSLPNGIVAYSGPPVAAQGGNVTYCVSNGKPLKKAAAAKKKKKDKKDKKNGKPKKKKKKRRN